MDPGDHRRVLKAKRALAGWRQEEGGFAFPSSLLLFFMVMLIILMGINLMMVWYADGVVRASLDEGARFGANDGNGAAECTQRANEWANDLLGSFSAEVSITCTDTGDRIRASATGQVPFWVQLGVLPPIDISHTAVVVKEPEVDP